MSSLALITGLGVPKHLPGDNGNYLAYWHNEIMRSTIVLRYKNKTNIMPPLYFLGLLYIEVKIKIEFRMWAKNLLT